MSAEPVAHGNKVLLSPCVRVACGEHYSAALTQSGELFMWGRGDSGQLGCSLPKQQVRACSRVPKHVPVPEAVIGISLGWDHTCCVTMQGTLYSWGAGTFGQLGHGDAEGRAASEVQGSHQAWFLQATRTGGRRPSESRAPSPYTSP